MLSFFVVVLLASPFVYKMFYALLPWESGFKIPVFGLGVILLLNSLSIIVNGFTGRLKKGNMKKTG